MKIKPKNLKDLDRGPVDCDNPQMMIAANLHPPYLTLNRAIFSKTKEEKEELKKRKNQHHAFMRTHGYSPSKYLNVVRNNEGNVVKPS